MSCGRRIIDLSVALADGVRGVASDPHSTIATAGYNTTVHHLYSHAGTHMDAPRHFVEAGGTIEDVDLSACVGPAEVIDVSHVGADGLITVADLAPHEARVVVGARLLLRTDWSRHLDQDDYRSHLPRVSLALAQWLVERRVALLGVEPPSVASVREGREVELRDVHRTLLAGGVVIVEGLCNLHELRQARVELIALPLKLQGGDGSPVRAIAIEREADE